MSGVKTEHGRREWQVGEVSGQELNDRRMWMGTVWWHWTLSHLPHDQSPSETPEFSTWPGDLIYLFCFFGVFLSGEQKLLLSMILSHCCNYTTFSSTAPVPPKHVWRSHSFFLACTEKNKVKRSLPQDEKTASCGQGGGEGVHKHSLPWTTNPRLYSILCLHQSLGMEDGGETWRPLWLHRSTLFSWRGSLCVFFFLYSLFKDEMMGTSNTSWSLNLEMQHRSPALSPNPDGKLTIFCSVHISMLTNRPKTAGPFQVCKDCW